jgi:hypothetical protein
VEAVDAGVGAREVACAEGFHILDCYFAVVVDVQGFEEGVHVLLLRVVGGVEDAVDVGQNGHGLAKWWGTLTGSMDPLRSLS